MENTQQLQGLGLQYNSSGKLDINTMRGNTTLRHEDWIKWDAAMIDAASKPLTMIQDLIDRGLVDSGYNMGDILSKYEKVSEMSNASITLDGLNHSPNDRITFTPTGVPIPIFRSDFTLGARQIQSSLNRPGGSLPVDTIKAATKDVAERMELMACTGTPGVSLDGLQVYGYTTFPDRNATVAAAPWGAGGSDPIADIEAAITAIQADNFGYSKDSCVLYVSADKWAFIDQDYSAVKGDKTFRQRFESYGPIEKVELGSQLPAGNCVLVEMDSTTVDLAVAQTLVNFEQPKRDAMQTDFTVMASMAIRVKSDYLGRCGVVNITGC